MWPRNDGTFVSPNGNNIPQQANNQTAAAIPLKRGNEAITPADAAKIKNSGDVNFNSLNGAYDPDDELDVTDSEFDDDSDYENDSEPDDEAAMNFFAQHLQNVHMPNMGVGDPYGALNALSQFSNSVIPNFNMQSPNTNDPNLSAIANVLAQMTASVAPNVNMQSQKVIDSSHNAVNAMSHIATPVTAHWQPPQIHGNQIIQNHAKANNDHSNTIQNGKQENKEKDDFAKKMKTVRDMHKHSTPKSTQPGSCAIRPRTQRREVGVELFQIRRREFEETFTTDESASSSPIKDITAKFKHLRLPRPNIFKIFQRNKIPNENLVTISPTSPDLRNAANGTDVIQSDGGKSQLQKISEVLLKPPDISTWTNNHQHLNDRSNFTGKLSSSFEKSIESFLFRSNFPENFFTIRLSKLGIEEVQQLVRQIDLLENVQDKLAETVLQESLSGPALMSCDLNELKKSLNLNLGHWTIFEQLIIGLRRIQCDEFVQLNNVEQNIDEEEIITNPEQANNKKVVDDPNVSETKPSQQIVASSADGAQIFTN